MPLAKASDLRDNRSRNNEPLIMDQRANRTEQPWLGSSLSHRTALVPPLSAARWLLVLVVAAGIYFFHDFLVPVLAALVIGFASWPLYRVLLRQIGGNRTVGATLAITLILVFLVVPIVVAVGYTLDEIALWFSWAVDTNETGAPTPDWIAELPLAGAWFDEQWTRYIGHPGALGELAQMVSGANIGNIYRAVLATGSGAFDVLLTLLFMMIVLFFVYRDGESFAAQLDQVGERILPLRWERISRVVPMTIRSTVVGMTLIAIGEGIVLGIAYWIAGVPSPVTLGVITGVLALVPGGAPLAMTLVSMYLVASGSPFAGIALFAWGSIELFIVDKTIRPKLVGGPISLPFLPTFFGLIGGVKTMGFLGIFVGPVLMALLVAIWREWVRDTIDGPARPEASAAVRPPPIEPLRTAGE
jgi:predicted PurR-regulated permease PerM